MEIDNERVKNEIKEEIKKFLETNENEHATAQNLRDIAKAVLRGKFIAMQAHLKKVEKIQINNKLQRLTFPRFKFIRRYSCLLYTSDAADE